MAPTISVFMPVDVALAQLISALQASNSPLNDLNEGSSLRTVFECFATVISNQSAAADQLQLDAYLDTATGSALDALGANNWLVPRLPAVQATGQITITRQSTVGALTLPAAWTQLAASPSAPGQVGVSVLTTAPANFPDTVGSVTVAAQAALPGSAGNLASGVYLTPLAAVNGISSQNGFQVTTAFTNGVDAETDTAYRARIPIAVQGRVLGKPASFQAAALSVPGVLSAGVLGAGQTRGDGSTVPAGSVEVYYQGSTGLLGAVTSAVDNAATLNQNPSAYASFSLSSPRGQKRVVANVTVYCLPGVNTTTLQANVQAALQTYVNGCGIGGTVYQAAAIEAMLAVSGVLTVQMPMTTFNLYPTSGSADLTIAGDSYANLAPGDTTVTVTVI